METDQLNENDQLYLIEPSWNEKKNSFKKLISNLVLYNRINLIEYLINNFYTLNLSKFGFERLEQYINYYTGLYGNRTLIDGKIAVNYDIIASGAAETARYEILDLFKFSQSTVNYIATGAAKGGHLNIVIKALNLGASNINLVAYYAAKYGHVHILKYALENGAIDIKEIAVGAAKGGYLNIVEELYRIKNFDLNSIVTAAVKKNKLNILIWAVSMGVKINSKNLKAAVEYGYIDIFKYIVENSYSLDLMEAIEIAARYDELEMFKYIIKHTDISIEELKQIAKKYKSKKIVKYLNNYCSLLGKRKRECSEEFFIETKNPRFV